jgi:hypothetical protein
MSAIPHIEELIKQFESERDEAAMHMARWTEMHTTAKQVLDKLYQTRRQVVELERKVK